MTTHPLDQDLLEDAFSGNVRGLGPAVAAMEIAQRLANSAACE